LGSLPAIQSFGNLVATGVAGLLWTLVSPLAAFLFASAGMIIAVAGLTARRHSGETDKSAAPTDPNHAG
jgi:hypothetical protein